MNRLFITLLLFAATFCNASAGIFWQMPIRHYIKQEYNGGTQNWMIRRGDNGWMYIANNKGLLEYDGVYWTQHSMGNDTKARSLCISGNDVYVGGLGEFGVFRPDKSGKLIYRCLSAKIRNRRSINVWNIFRIREKVYFQADNTIFAYSTESGRIERTDSKSTIYCAAAIGEKVYVATTDGLWVLSGRQLVRISGSEILQGTKVVAMLPYGKSVVAVTASSGLFVFDGHMMRKMKLDIGGKLDFSRLSCADVRGEMLALGTVHDGLILYDLHSHKAKSITAADGLQNNSLLSLRFDGEKNLWAGFYNGIDCMNVVSPLSMMSCSGADIGSGYASCTFGGKLFLGTNQGLYSAMPHNNAEEMFIQGADGLIHCLLPFDGRLFCGGRNFLGVYDGNSMHKLNIRGVWKIIPVKRMQNTLLLGTYWGLYLMKKNGETWMQPQKIADRGVSTKALCIEDGANAVWVANKSKGIWRYTMSDDFTRVLSGKQYNGKSLPTGENVCIATIGGQLVVASPQGLFRYDITEDRLERDMSLEKMLGGRKAYTYIFQDTDGNIWFAADETLFLLRYDKRKRHYAASPEAWLHGNLITDYENVNVAGGNALLGTEDGFASLRLATARMKKCGVKVQIRRVFSTADGTDSLLIEPRGNKNAVTDGDLLKVDYDRAALRIEYCATDYDPAQTVLYSYRLDGSDNEEWSEFSPIHVKEFTHLHEGKYTFRVRIMVNGVMQKNEGSFAFQILPPWYRSWWAWLIYMLLVLLAARYAYMRIAESRQKIIRSSEQRMAEQQQQFDSINEKKDQQIESLQLKNTEMELRIKNEELVNTQLNVVRKNEILQDIRSMVVKIANVVSEDNVPLVKRRLVKLMNQIDTNISHDDDLQAFQGSFNAVHHDFLKVLGERYPALSHKDRMLCVYIRMNMQTKEIAPLLGISVRGVEISRYRLRKKLKLEERESLTDFLQGLTD